MRITDKHGTHGFYDVSRYPPSHPRPHCAFPWLLDKLRWTKAIVTALSHFLVQNRAGILRRRHHNPTRIFRSTPPPRPRRLEARQQVYLSASVLSTLPDETRDFEPYLPVSRLEPETSRIIAKVCHFLQTRLSDNEISNILRCLSYFVNIERFLRDRSLFMSVAGSKKYFGNIKSSVRPPCRPCKQQVIPASLFNTNVMAPLPTHIFSCMLQKVIIKMHVTYQSKDDQLLRITMKLTYSIPKSAYRIDQCPVFTWIVSGKMSYE